MRLPFFVASMRFILHVCVECMRGLLSCCGFVCLCLLVFFRVIVHGFAIVCGEVAFHIQRV